MRSRLGYLHMPKAAGTSIRAAFASYYDPADTVPYSFDRHLFGDDPRIDEIREPLFLGEPDELRGYRYMEGHWALPTMAAVLEPSEIVCVLREPRARFLSHYTFWRGWPDSMHELWEPYGAARFAQLALSDYCREPAIAHQADNLVTRLLLGPHPLIPNDAHIRARRHRCGRRRGLPPARSARLRRRARARRRRLSRPRNVVRVAARPSAAERDRPGVRPAGRPRRSRRPDDAGARRRPERIRPADLAPRG